MTDTQTEPTDQQTEAAPSAETQSWARRILVQHRAVDQLHSAEPRWQIRGAEEGTSWSDRDEALEVLRDGGLENEAQPDATEAGLSFFLVCRECAHIEETFVNDQLSEVTEWGYESSLWPCRTAVAMGHDQETA